MTEIFEFLFKYRPVLYEKGTIAFRPLLPPYGLLAVIALAALISYLLYRRTGSVLPGFWRYGFLGLRTGAFAVLIFLFSQPVLRLRSVIPQQNFVAIAYDQSKSMEIRDAGQGQSRLDQVRHLLRRGNNPMLEDLGARFKLRFFRFSSSPDRTDGYQELPRHGNGTNLGNTLEQIAAELATAPIAGIVLVTDGADNRSADLEKTAAQLRARNIPVYPVGIGSDDFAHDVEILGVTAPRKVLKDTVVEADVSIRSNGYAGRHARLLVLEGKSPLQNQDIILGSDGEVKTYKASFSTRSSGPRAFTFRIEPFDNEIVAQNNEQSVLIRVEDEQPRILYVEGEPRWEYGFLRRAILEDKNISLVTLLRQADGKFLRQGVESGKILEKGFPNDKAELFQYKAIILGSVEASFFTFDQLRMISDFVSQRGGGFLMMGGPKSFSQGGYANTPLEDLLPVRLQPAMGSASVFQDLEYKVRLTPYGWQHPVTRLSLSEDQNRKRWEAAPPLVGFNPTGGPKPGATVLAQGSVPDSRGQSPIILAFQRFGQGKSMALTTGTTWRWRMGLEHKDHFYELFWKQMQRWLVSDVPDPVQGSAEKHSYSLDDSVAIAAEACDSSFLPVNNARVTARVKAPSGQITSLPMVWVTEKEGVYSAAYKPKEDGIYEVSTEAFLGDRSLGTATSNFRVADTNDEFHASAMNAGLLNRLSAQTGGRFFTADDVRTLPEDISYIDKGFSRMEEKDLWDMPFLFLLLVGLISTEWILRKRKGLV
jgi:uncharacterized membrane protein